MGIFKTAIITIVSAGTVFGLYKIGTLAVKGIEAKDGLKVGIDSVKPNVTGKVTIFSVAQYIASSIPMRIVAKLKNATANTYKIQGLLVEIYTIDNKLIASQDKPITKEIVVRANSTALMPLDFTMVTLATARLFKGINFKDIIEFLSGGKLGKKIRVKGILRAEGFTLPLDEIIEI